MLRPTRSASNGDGLSDRAGAVDFSTMRRVEVGLRLVLEFDA